MVFVIQKREKSTYIEGEKNHLATIFLIKSKNSYFAIQFTNAAFYSQFLAGKDFLWAGNLFFFFIRIIKADSDYVSLYFLFIYFDIFVVVRRSFFYPDNDFIFHVFLVLDQVVKLTDVTRKNVRAHAYIHIVKEKKRLSTLVLLYKDASASF